MSNPFLGEIRMFSFNFPPHYWAFCNGQLLSISQNTALFSLLGTMYGGDGATTFALPDLRGRTPVSIGTFAGVTVLQGEKGGLETVTLTAATTPQHTHLVNATTTVGNKRPPSGKLFAADNASIADFYRVPGTTVALDNRSVTSSGGSQAHANLQPCLATNYCIALQGIFPSRN